MLKFSKMVLVGTIVVLLGGVLAMPTVNGLLAGTSRETAAIMTPGIYLDEYRPGGQAAWYNVSGKVGANLTVIITYIFPNASRLNLESPNGTPLDASETLTGTEIVSVICDSNLYYTIIVTPTVTVRGPVVDVLFNLSICLDDDCGQGGGGIPGFSLLYMSVGILALLGLIFWTRKQMNQAI